MCHGVCARACVCNTHIMTEEHRAVDDDTANQIGQTPMVPIIFSDHLLRMRMRHTDTTSPKEQRWHQDVQGAVRNAYQRLHANMHLYGSFCLLNGTLEKHN